MPQEITIGELLKIEYDQLKQEQRGRITVRDNLMYGTLGSMALVVAAALQAKGHANLLLLLPPVTVILGWTYLVNDEKISAIGRYVRESLAPRLSALAQGSDPVFGWETTHRSDARRTSRKIMQLAIDLGTFCVPALAAVIIYWVNGPLTAWFLVISLFEATITAVLAIQIIRHAEF